MTTPSGVAFKFTVCMVGAGREQYGPRGAGAASPGPCLAPASANFAAGSRLVF